MECDTLHSENRLSMILLTNNFPKWQLVYYYYSKWADLEIYHLILDKLRRKVRVNMGQNLEASLWIMDSQSVLWE